MALLANSSVMRQFDEFYSRVLHTRSFNTLTAACQCTGHENVKSMSSSAAWMSSRGTHCEFLTGLETVRRSVGCPAGALLNGCAIQGWRAGGAGGRGVDGSQGGSVKMSKKKCT